MRIGGATKEFPAGYLNTLADGNLKCQG